MLSVVLIAALVLAAPVKGIEEVWQGTLNTDLVKVKGKKKKAAPRKVKGDRHRLTIKIKRQGTKFTGEWIEDGRALNIAGNVTNRRFEVTSKEVKRGEWKAGVLDDLQIVGEFDKNDSNTLHGQLFGKGGKTERSGEFSVTKKVAADGED